MQTRANPSQFLPEMVQKHIEMDPRVSLTDFVEHDVTVRSEQVLRAYG